MDYLASYTLLPLRLAGNQLIENVSSPDAITERANLLYRLDIYRPKAYQSGTFVIHESLRGREAPAYIDSGIVFSEGCNFDLSEFVWGLLSATPPKATQTTITVQPLATMPYYQKNWVEPYQETTEVTTGIRYLLRGKLDENQFATWRENFFTVFLQEKRSFLTWQPATEKITDRNQPEFLSYLVHHDPLPTQLKLRVDVEYTDGTRTASTLTPIILENVDNYSLYTIPVGFEALGLDALEVSTGKTVLAYKLWLSNQDTQQLTETRRYVVNNDYQPYVRHIVFLNSLGGWDSVRVVGISKTQLLTNSTTVKRQLEDNYTPSDEEIFVTNITGERRLTLNTGYLSRSWLEYLEELQWSDKIFVNTNAGLEPIVMVSNTFDGPDDEENFGGRTFVFRAAKQAKGYSLLPSASLSTIARPTVWLGTSGYCIVNENGVRTGKKAFSILELHYADGLYERVAGVPRKANTPETEGYIAPIVSEDCYNTPFLNTLISLPSSFTKNDCNPGSIGNTPTIVIAAGEYGSENSQMEAQSRAEAGWAARNTQAYANQIGTCTLLFQSAAISRLSTYTKSGCAGGLTGSRWTIVVAAGAYTSAISQIDADNQANAYANALDTQSNADAYGSCVAAQFYWVPTTAPRANFRMLISVGLSTYWRIAGDFTTQLLNTNTLTDVQNNGYCYISYYANSITASYEVYVNGVLTSSATNVSVTGTGGWSNFLTLPTVSAGDMVYVKIY